MRHRDIERQLRDTGERAGEQVHRYADSANERAHGLVERARDLGARWGQRGDSYRRRLSHTAEDFADEANYQYRRARRQMSRHPFAAAAIVAGTVGAFLLLRRAFHNDD
jgi:ElaB/YqjD/DUF883 family membrane-anchored ribosome-binding protein